MQGEDRSGSSLRERALASARFHPVGTAFEGRLLCSDEFWPLSFLIAAVTSATAPDTPPADAPKDCPPGTGANRPG